jgi:hypothetical protein
MFSEMIFKVIIGFLVWGEKVLKNNLYLILIRIDKPSFVDSFPFSWEGKQAYQQSVLQFCLFQRHTQMVEVFFIDPFDKHFGQKVKGNPCLL